jgi:hypothetical protein
VYDVIEELISVEMDWYRSHYDRFRKASEYLRAFTVLLLGIGILLPVLNVTLATIISAEAVPSATSPIWIRSYGVAQCGYAALLLAGFLLLADQVFLASRSRARYLTAELNLYEKLQRIRFKWLELQAEWGATEPQNEQAQIALEGFFAMAAEAMGIVREETQVWSTELDAALQTLRNEINVHTQSAGNSISPLQTTVISLQDPSNGVIKVEVTGQLPYELYREGIPVTIRCESPRISRSGVLEPPGNRVFDGLREGVYVISVGANSQRTRLFEDAVRLEKGQITSISIDSSKLFVGSDSRPNGEPDLATDVQ